MTELKLRPYQSEAIDAVFTAWSDGMMRPAIVLPTGAGKTVVFSHLVKRFRDWHPALTDGDTIGKRVIILVHRDELADQAIAKLRSIAPDLNVGKVKAHHDESYADVMVCSVQTLAVERRRKGLVLGQVVYGDVGLIITDECHHGSAASYQKVYAAFPDALQLGVTATMARGDGVGLGSTWEEVVFSRSVLWMISKGFLCDVKAVSVKVDGLDMASISASRGDYQAGALGDAMEAAGAEKVIARAYKEHAGDRQGIVFTPTVETAEETAEAMNSAGIPSVMISGSTPTEDRSLIYEDFRAGRTQVLVNCMVLTEGFDAPWASCAVIARPTQSNPLYVQMVGRVLRPYPGKADALVLDLVGASASNKLRTLVDLAPEAVTSVLEGELLADAVVREAEAAEETPRQGSIAFALKHREISMFAASEMAWSRTRKGVLFIECGDTTVFLWRKDASWDVCTIAKGEGPKYTLHRGLDLSAAMAWGEAVAEDHASFGVHRGASWRKTKPSEKQVQLAERMGIDASGMRKGELSEAIAIVIKSQLFDPNVPA